MMTKTRLTKALGSTKMIWVILIFIAFILLSTMGSAYYKNNFLTGYWKLNENLGNANDSSIYGNNLTITPTNASYQVGKLGNAIRMNSTSNFGLRGNNSINYAFNQTNFTIAFWFNASNCGSGGTLPIISQFNWDIICSSSGKLGTRWLGDPFNPSIPIRDSSMNVADSLWHRIVFIRNGLAQADNLVYVDGFDTSTGTTIPPPSYDGTMGNNFSGNFTISHGGDSGQVWIDDLRIYKGYAWNSYDIKSDYNNGFGREEYNGTLINSVNYTSPVSTLSLNQFLINISYDSSYYLTANAYLNYNNTNYSTTKSGAGDTIAFNTNIHAPLVNVNRNVSFYWMIVLNNGTTTEYYNSNIYNQSVLSLNYGNCNATNTIPLLNFTLSDENTRSQLTLPTYNNTYNIDIKIGDSSLTNYVQYSANSSGNSYAICSNVTITNIRMDYTMQYGSNAHVTEFYNVQNYILNSISASKNITLYPLLTTNSQEFLIKTKDANFLPLSNIVVEIYRKYVEIGQNLLVEAPKTDSLGNTIGHFETNDVLYKIILKKDGAVLGTFDGVQVYCNVALTDCLLNLNLQTSSANPNSFINYGGISYLPTYNEATRTYYVDFTVIDGSDKKVDLYGFNLANTQNTLVCSSTITASSGTLPCAFTGLHENSTILINAYVDNSLLFTDYVRANYVNSDKLKNIRYILLAFIIPFFAMFSLASGSIAIVLYIIGLLFGVGIFMLDTQSIIGAGSFIIWFIVAGIILIIKIMKGGIKNG